MVTPRDQVSVTVCVPALENVILSVDAPAPSLLSHLYVTVPAALVVTEAEKLYVVGHTALVVGATAAVTPVAANGTSVGVGVLVGVWVGVTEAIGVGVWVGVEDIFLGGVGVFLAVGLGVVSTVGVGVWVGDGVGVGVGCGKYRELQYIPPLAARSKTRKAKATRIGTFWDFKIFCGDSSDITAHYSPFYCAMSNLDGTKAHVKSLNDHKFQ